MLGYGVAATAFAGLAISLTIRREIGNPQAPARDAAPRGPYFGGVLGSTLLVYAIEAVALVAIGRLGFDAAFPARLGSLVLALLLGARRLRGDGDRADRR